MKTTDITFLMVTHSFSEALSLADRAAVMNNGTIEHIDTVQNLFRKPKTEFIADFVGMKNIYYAKFSGDSAFLGDMRIRLARSVEQPGRKYCDSPGRYYSQRESFGSKCREHLQRTNRRFYR